MQPYRNAALVCKRAALNPGTLDIWLGSPSAWHPAEGKRAKRAILALRSLLRHSHQARSGKFSQLLRKDPLGLFWALSRQDRIIQPIFFPSSPGCVLPFLLTSNTICYSLLRWCPDWYLIFKLFSYLPALLMRASARSIFCLFGFFVLFCFLCLFLLFWKTSSSFSWSTLQHQHLGLES